MAQGQMRSLDGNQIRNISAAGLVFLNERGSEEFIDFQQCYENYIRWNTSPEALERAKAGNHLDDEQLKSHVEEIYEWKEVAYRGIDGFPWSGAPSENPAIQFHTEPPIRFVFATEDQFYETYIKIRRLGWQTIDIS